MPATKKTENKTLVEKAVKIVSPKKQTEAEHLAGKHTEKGDNLDMMKKQAQEHPDCGLCGRRVVRGERRQSATKAYYVGK